MNLDMEAHLAQPTLPVLSDPNLPQVFSGAIDRLIDQVGATTADRSQQLRRLIHKKECASYALVGVAQVASAYLNLGEIAKAQNLLQGAVLDFQLAEQRVLDFQKENRNGNPTTA